MSSQLHIPRTPAKQRGATLIIAIIVLLLVSMLALYGSRGSIVQNLMARNTRDHDLAFQAAEAALRDAETRLAGFAVGAGMLDHQADTAIATYTTADYWLNGYNWSDTNTLSMQGGMAGVSKSPRYVIERLADTAVICSDAVSTPQKHFRATTLAVGKSTETRVMLQAEYTYCPPAAAP